MKKILSVILALTMLLTLCGAALAEGEVTVTLFHNKVEIDTQLKDFAAVYNEKHPGVKVEIETLGGGADYAGTLAAKQNADNLPTLFVIEGEGDYNLWKDYIVDYTGQEWTKYTELSYKNESGIWGFPVSVEGFGLGYNANILEAAGIDPATLTTYSAVKAAFEKIDSMKAELGLDCVVSMGASIAGGLWWVTANHDFSIYLGGGLAADDTSVIDAFNKGELDKERFLEYAAYLKLLFDYADKDVLLNGNYDQQLALFTEKKAAFIHQGNWIDPSLVTLGVDFDYSYIAHCFNDKQEHTGLYLFAPSFYCLNKAAADAEQAAALDFLNFMVTSEEGAEYMVNAAGMVPAFSTVTLQPQGGFSKALVAANAKGGNHGVFFGKMESGLSQNYLAPIFEMFAQDPSDEAMQLFMQDIENLIAKYK